MLFDLLLGPLSDYLIHGISAARMVLRVFTGVLFLVGGYVLLEVPAPLRYLAVPLLVVAGLYTLYDLATIARHTR